MKDTVKQIDIVYVQPDAAALEQIQQIGFGIFGNIPDCSWPDSYILGLLYILQNRMGLPDSSSILDSCEVVRFNSRCGSSICDKSEIPQNFFGSLRLG